MRMVTRKKVQTKCSFCEISAVTHVVEICDGKPQMKSFCKDHRNSELKGEKSEKGDADSPDVWPDMEKAISLEVTEWQLKDGVVIRFEGNEYGLKLTKDTQDGHKVRISPPKHIKGKGGYQITVRVD